MLGRKATSNREVVLAVKFGDGDGASIVADGAVDQDHTDFDAYKESLWDMKHVKIADGETPTVFTIRPLTKAQKDAVDGIDGSRAKAQHYLKYGLVDVRGYRLEGPDGKTIDAPRPTHRSNGKLGMVVPDEWFDEVDLPAEHLMALFSMIAYISEAQVPLSKRSRPQSGAASQSSAAST